jgi:hypothetical protein
LAARSDPWDPASGQIHPQNNSRVIGCESHTTRSQTQTRTHTLTLTNSHLTAITHAHTLSLTHTHTLAHTHTHTRTRTHTRAHTIHPPHNTHTHARARAFLNLLNLACLSACSWQFRPVSVPTRRAMRPKIEPRASTALATVPSPHPCPASPPCTALGSVCCSASGTLCLAGN